MFCTYFRNFFEMIERKTLASSLEAFKTLRQLKLDLSETELDDSTLNRLTILLGNMEFLESLTFKLSKTPISSESFEHMLKKLEKLPNLSQLHVAARDVRGLQGKEERLLRIVNELKVADTRVRF